MKTDKKGRLFIISAPSGAGKGTVIKRLLEIREELVYSVSATTRLPRKGETEGKSYYFVEREQFLQMIENGDFLEYTQYVGEYYGTPKKPIYDSVDSGKDVLLEIEVQGAKQVMAADPGSASIFIVPPDMEELERRLRGRRTESEEKLASRLERARTEMEEMSLYDHIVVNDDVSRAATEILSIIDAN